MLIFPFVEDCHAVLTSNQRKLDEVFEHIFHALLGGSRASIGKGIFHLQYTLWGEGGPYSKT